ncbi:MAG: hypothetical protein QGG87_03205, partial [Nitrospinota bacterium]|nr:hypothetical protein [Nitrospinota bacterium]
LENNYSIHYSPLRTSVETVMDINIPPKVIWKKLTDISRYSYWFPGIHKLFVVNKTDRWVQKQSLHHYLMEPGNKFQIRPFLLSPKMACRLISVEKEKQLSMEIRFFPFNRELVTFTLKHYKNCVELHYKSENNNPLSFLTVALFSWKGRDVLINLASILPEVTFSDEPVKEGAANGETIEFTEDLLNALALKALDEGMDILNTISDKPTRGRIKSLSIKIKRSNKRPEVSQETMATAASFLGDGSLPYVKTAQPVQSAVSKEVLINQYILKALDGDKEILNTIEDKVLRAKAKSAFVKAKRSGERPELPEGIPMLGESASGNPEQTDGGEIPAEKPAAQGSTGNIESLVQQALETGSMDAINAIEDKVFRAKVRSALIKAKRAKK